MITIMISNNSWIGWVALFTTVHRNYCIRILLHLMTMTIIRTIVTIPTTTTLQNPPPYDHRVDIAHTSRGGCGMSCITVSDPLPPPPPQHHCPATAMSLPPLLLIVLTIIIIIITIIIITTISIIRTHQIPNNNSTLLPHPGIIIIHHQRKRNVVFDHYQLPFRRRRMSFGIWPILLLRRLLVLVRMLPCPWWRKKAPPSGINWHDRS